MRYHNTQNVTCHAAVIRFMYVTYHAAVMHHGAGIVFDPKVVTWKLQEVGLCIHPDVLEVDVDVLAPIGPGVFMVES